MTKCPRCESDRLYQFEASPSVLVRAAPLPVVCRQCGQITIGGEAINLPEPLEKQALDMAAAAELAAKEVTEELLTVDAKSLRIEGYFNTVYRRAYLDGFFRCLAFYQHHAKEGRLRRMRELWNTFEVSKSRLTSPIYGQFGDQVPVQVMAIPVTVSVRMPEPMYTEFEQLLSLSVASEKPNAKSPTDKNPTVQDGRT